MDPTIEFNISIKGKGKEPYTKKVQGLLFSFPQYPKLHLVLHGIEGQWTVSEYYTGLRFNLAWDKKIKEHKYIYHKSAEDAIEYTFTIIKRKGYKEIMGIIENEEKINEVAWEVG